MTVSDKYSIRRSENGYIIRVEMKSNSDYKKLPDDRLWAQLLVKPYQDKNDVYLMVD